MLFLLILPTFLHRYCCCDFLVCAYLTHLNRFTRLCICFGDAESYKESLGCVHTKPVFCSLCVCPHVKFIKTGEINAVLNSGAVCLRKRTRHKAATCVCSLIMSAVSFISSSLSSLCSSCCYVHYDRGSACAVRTDT